MLFCVLFHFTCLEDLSLAIVRALPQYFYRAKEVQSCFWTVANLPDFLQSPMLPIIVRRPWWAWKPNSQNHSVSCSVFGSLWSPVTWKGSCWDRSGQKWPQHWPGYVGLLLARWDRGLRTLCFRKRACQLLANMTTKSSPPLYFLLHSVPSLCFWSFSLQYASVCMRVSWFSKTCNCWCQLWS